MPNWVRNNVEFGGNSERIRSLLSEIREDGKPLGSIDFQKVIPMPRPLNIEAGSRTQEGLKMYKRYVMKDGLQDMRECLKYAEEHPDRWELGRQAYENELMYGYIDWYDWCVDNWGTKWNANNLNESGDMDSLHFETAWEYPEPVFYELSRRYPDVGIYVDYADEDIGRNCGRVSFIRGQKYEDIDLVSRPRAVEFACSVWGVEPEDYNLYLNADGTDYEYRREDGQNA